MLSIIVPGIRPQRWEELYDSIHNSTSRPFEVIFIGPYPPPRGHTHQLSLLPNVKWIQDWGNPVRCSDIGLSAATGELVTWSADDGMFFGHGCIDKAVDAFLAMENNEKNVLVCKYQEGDRVTQNDDYYKLRNAYPVVANAGDWWIFNLVITRTNYLRDHMGGWDAVNFHTLAFAHADAAIRFYQDGAITQLYPEAFVHCTHGHDDHKPIEQAHWENDHPRYLTIHNDPASKSRITLDKNHWRLTEAVWKRRFP